MPATLPEPPLIRSPRAVAWTRADCARLADAGLLPERWELVAGEIISKTGQNLPHGKAVMRAVEWFLRVFGIQFVVTHVSIDVSPEDNPTSEPEPDLTLLRVPADSIAGNPTPLSIALVVEVSDTTLRYDLTVKRDLYARAGIAEYWVIDIQSQRVHLFRDPAPQGYRSTAILEGADMLTPPGRPSEGVAIAQLLAARQAPSTTM